MSEVKMPPPLPNPPASGATPPPLPDVKPSTPPPLPKISITAPPPLPQAKAAVPPPIPTNNSVATNTPSPPSLASQLPADSNPVTSPSSTKIEVANAPSLQGVPPPPVSAEDSHHSQQPQTHAISPTKSSKVSKLVWLIGGVVGLTTVGSVGFYVFSKKEAVETPLQVSKAQTETSASQAQAPSIPNAPAPQEIQAPPAAVPEAAAPAPESSNPAPIPNQGGDMRDERIKQLEQQLAQAELEKQKAQELTAQKKKTDVNQAATPTTSLAAPTPAPIPAVSSGNTPKGFKPESRSAGESCNVNSDCTGTLKCNAGQCGVATKAIPSTTTSNNTTHLVDSYYVFNGSVKNLGNGFRSIYVVSNADVLPGAPYHGQVKSQVARYVMNCQTGQWGYDQLYFHASTFGDGQRIAAQEWQPNQVAFNPIQGALSFINKAYQTACR